MGTKIIQDGNKFGLFSTFSDRIWALDLTEEEMIELWAKQAAHRAREEMRKWLDDLKDERHWQEPMTLDEALENHRTHPAHAAEEWDKGFLPEIEFDDQLLKQFPGKVRPRPIREQDDGC